MRDDFIFLGPLRVELTPEENAAADKRITEFCNAMNAKGQSCDYIKEEREAHKPETDIYVGKKAEEFVAKAFGIDSSLIDYEIRQNKAKGWRPDFFDNWHVKGCTDTVVELAMKHNKGPDKSWTFQLANKNSSGGVDPLLAQKIFDKTQYVIFVYMANPQDAVGYIEAICPWHYIKSDRNHLLEPPILEYLAKYKRCTYLSTMTKCFLLHPDKVSKVLLPYVELT